MKLICHHDLSHFLLLLYVPLLLVNIFPKLDQPLFYIPINGFSLCQILSTAFIQVLACLPHLFLIALPLSPFLLPHSLLSLQLILLFPLQQHLNTTFRYASG